MAEEATIQGVVSELQVINQLIHDTTDMHLEALIGIESVASAIDVKVGRMLEQPAIQESLEKFSQDIVEGITGSFDAALEYQKQQDKERDREEKGEVQSGKKKGFGESVKDSFQSGLKRGPSGSKALSGLGNTIKELIETAGEIAATMIVAKQFLGNKDTYLKPFRAIGNFFSNLGSRIFTFLSGFRNMQFFEVLKNMVKSLSKLAIPLTLVIGTIGGLIEAFNYFNEAGDGMQSKFMAALEGFFAGFLGTLLAPLDWIMHAIGDFFGIEWMQKLSIVEEAKYAVEVFFNLFEDFGQSLKETYDMLAASPVGQSFKQLWEDITGAIDKMMSALKAVYNKIAKYVPGLPMIGEDTREQGKTAADYTMDRKEQRENVKAARNSGLYDSNIYGDSEINKEMIKEAPTSQLISIVKDDDLSPEDEKMVLQEIASREKRKAALDTQMGATVEAPATPEVVNDASTSSVLQEISVPTREAKTIPAAMSREPKVAKTGYELAQENPNVMVMPSSGKFRATNPEMPLETGTKFFDTYAEAAEWASKDPSKRGMEIGGPDVVQQGTVDGTAVLSGKPTVAGGLEGNAAQSAELESRQNDLADQLATNIANDNASNVVVADNSQQQSIVQNNVTSGVNPGPFDRSDRTHRRGAYRGT
jgi:hypothetical protein